MRKIYNRIMVILIITISWSAVYASKTRDFFLAEKGPGNPTSSVIKSFHAIHGYTPFNYGITPVNSAFYQNNPRVANGIINGSGLQSGLGSGIQSGLGSGIPSGLISGFGDNLGSGFGFSSQIGLGYGYSNGLTSRLRSRFSPHIGSRFATHLGSRLSAGFSFGLGSKIGSRLLGGWIHAGYHLLHKKIDTIHLRTSNLKDNRQTKPYLIFSAPSFNISRKLMLGAGSTAALDFNNIESQYQVTLGNFSVSSPIHDQLTLSYSIGRDYVVTAKIFNVLGTEVTTLFSQYRFAGQHREYFNLADKVSSGIYILKLSAGNEQMAKRIQVL